MKAKTLMNKIIIVGGLSACLLLGGCGAGCDICRKHGYHTGKHRNTDREHGSDGNCQHGDGAGRSTAS